MDGFRATGPENYFRTLKDGSLNLCADLDEIRYYSVSKNCSYSLSHNHKVTALNEEWDSEIPEK